MTYTEEL